MSGEGAGGPPVMLRVLKGSPARALYERLGFEGSAETGTPHEMRREPDRRADGAV